MVEISTSPWAKALAMSQSKEWACQQAAAFRLPATQLEWDGLMDHHHALPGVTGVKGFPSPVRFQGSLGLSSGMGWRDCSFGQGPTKMHSPLQDDLGGALWSSAATSQVPCHCDSELQLTCPTNLDVAEKDPCGPHLWRECTITNALGGTTSWCSCSYRTECLSASRSHTNKGTCPCAKAETIASPCLFPLVGWWVWLTPTGKCELAHKHTPRSPTGFSSLGSIQVTILHFPVIGGEVCCEYQFQTIALMSLTQAPHNPAQLKPLDPHDSEFWANVMLFTYSMSDYTTPKPLRSNQECVVSSFLSLIWCK